MLEKKKKKKVKRWLKQESSGLDKKLLKIWLKIYKKINSQHKKLRPTKSLRRNL